MRTPSEARKWWAEELRGGRFQQCTGALEIDGQNCCLGVACRLYMEDGGELDIRVTDNQYTLFNGACGGLPAKVKDWLGLTDNYAFVDGRCDTLTSLNDNGKSFSEIADIIESGRVMVQ